MVGLEGGAGGEFGAFGDVGEFAEDGLGTGGGWEVGVHEGFKVLVSFGSWWVG